MVNESRQAGAENNLDEMLRALREATINLERLSETAEFAARRAREKLEAIESAIKDESETEL